MTPPTPTRPAVQGVPLLMRWKLAEPVRLFCYGWLLLLAIAVVVAAAFTRGWWSAALELVVLLLVVPGVEAARASAYSSRSVMGERVDAALRARLGREVLPAPAAADENSRARTRGHTR